MTDKRFIRTVSTILLIAIALSGCKGKTKEREGQPAEGKEMADVLPEKEAAGSSAGTGVTPTATPTPAPTDTPIPTPTPKIENIDNNEEGHFTFQRHVFSSTYLKEFGEEYQDAMFAFCDAVYNGDDTFDCPSQEVYDWCIGRLSFFFCPIATVYVARFSPDGSPTYKNGKGYIFYTIPKDEYLTKEKEFEEAIVGIINDCVSDDYTDMEKVLALYEYMCRNYTYDYDMYEHKLDRNNESAYRCLVEKTGICSEVAALYNFLLLQVGVDSDEMSGTGTDHHSWVYVTIDGESYHVDATWGLEWDVVPLDYFMMTDELREVRDGFKPETLRIGAKGDQCRKYHEFSSEDPRYTPLWETYYVGMDRENKEIVYEDRQGNIGRFYYGAN